MENMLMEKVKEQEESEREMGKQTAGSLASLTLKGNIRFSLKQSFFSYPHHIESSTPRVPAPTM
jgi:hypothetical protein